MVKFNFTAATADGKKVDGVVEAVNEQDAKVKMRAQGLEPLKVSLVVKNKSILSSLQGGVKSKELQVFTRQLSTMINSGVPLVQALEMLAKGSKTPALKEALDEIVLDVGRGDGFSTALGKYPKIFDNLYCNMVRVGEEGGLLDVILNRLAVYIEKSVALRSKIKGAMFYPVAIVVVAGLVIAGIMTFVIPKFQDLFAGSGQELPALTQFVIMLSDNFLEFGTYGLVGLVVAIIAFKKWKGTPGGRKTFDKALLKVPLFGKLAQMGAIARFSRTFGILTGAGVGILDSLDVCIRIVGNSVVEEVLDLCKESIRLGRSLVEPMKSAPVIPDMMTQMIGVAEETGAMEEMLSKVADFYEAEVDVLVDSLTSIMEPIIMVVLGGIIAVLVIAMYLPIFNLASAVG